MTHLFGIPINEKKEIWSALSDIPGIGQKKGRILCKETGIFHKLTWKDLSQKQKKHLKDQIIRNIGKENPLGVDLQRDRRDKKKALIKLGTFRGIRLRLGLPVRGQRTHSNGKTARRVK